MDFLIEREYTNKWLLKEKIRKMQILKVKIGFAHNKLIEVAEQEIIKSFKLKMLLIKEILYKIDEDIMIILKSFLLSKEKEPQER